MPTREGLAYLAASWFLVALGVIAFLGGCCPGERLQNWAP
jgi:hypothetical protein